MDQREPMQDDRFSVLSMTLNALERSRANERFLDSYKCPCNQCKGGGRLIQRLTIETHLRRHGRDPALTHSMLPEDSDFQNVNYNMETENVETEENFSEPVQQSVDKEFDFERMAREWFGGVDERRENGFGDEDMQDEGNGEGREEIENTADPNLEEWLKQSQVPLYDGSKLSSLACVLVLMNLAHLHNVSNSFMNELFSFLRLDMLPSSNALPRNRHEALRFVDRLGLSFNTIHACRNGCVLFWKDKAALSQCPKCKDSRYVVGSSSVPVKVLRHFPLIPRLLRMYRCRDIAALMTWHAVNSTTDGKVRSPLDSPAWKEVQKIDNQFYEGSRNVKLGLALDGMNPFADKSTRHSTWPVFLLNYNLPGWMVTKRFFVMLSLLIPGKESVKSSNVDVYLEPLLDELLLLWDGVPAVDMSKSGRPEPFELRGILLWTIHDYPAYGLVFGCATKGYQGCPICGPLVDSRFSKSLRKNLFQGHRRYLPESHPFRFLSDSFNGKQEHRGRPPRVSSTQHRRRGEARDRWIQAGGKAGSESDPVKRNGIKRLSLLFKLPYWERLLIRHLLDVMHCEKNVAENLLFTLMGMKDGPAVRNDMKEVGCKKSLHIREALPPQTGFHVPTTPYTLTAANKRTFIERLRTLKTPTGYMSNLKSKIDADGSIHGLKSHDYHVLLQYVIPVCLCGLLLDRVMKPILLLSQLFRKICSKVQDPALLESLHEEVAIVMCLLEQEFPPSFFDPMTHLVVHLVEELHLCGPVQNRWMYPLERYMKYMKTYVRNKARPEGCMATGTAMEVALGLSTEYILECESTGRRVWDADEEPGDSGEVTCAAFKFRTLSSNECQWAHSCVLQNSRCLDGLRETHKRLSVAVTKARADYRRSIHPRQRKRLEFPREFDLIPDFPEWLDSVVRAGNDSFEDDVVDLSLPPRMRTRSFKSMKAYGKQFRVCNAEENLVTTDSGVSATCQTVQRSGIGDPNSVTGPVTYFGTVKEILELDYGRLKPLLLLCDWVAPISRGPAACEKKDKFGFTLVKLRRLMRRSSNSFVFPLQASKFFFAHSVEEPEWSTVIRTEPRSTRIYECNDFDDTVSLFCLDEVSLMEKTVECEEIGANYGIDGTQGSGQHITEEEMVAAEIAADREAQQLEEDGSEDDTLLDLGEDEDEVFSY